VDASSRRICTARCTACTIEIYSLVHYC
jgi:hypothetical protein